MNDYTTQTFAKSTALEKMAEVCRSLEAYGVDVLRCTLDSDSLHIHVFDHMALWNWAKLYADLEITTEPWDHPSPIYPYHTFVVYDGVMVEALMDKDDCKEAGV